MCVVAVSRDCGDRAAGRYRWQYSGAHRCEPPLSVWFTVGSADGTDERLPEEETGTDERLREEETGTDGPQHGDEPSPTRWCAENSVVVHSQTLPIMSTSPNPFCGKMPTGEVPNQPAAPSLRYGNRPCQVLAINRPPGIGSSPHA